MAKPILLIGIPFLTPAAYAQAEQRAKLNCPDYNVLVHPSTPKRIGDIIDHSMQFQVFYEKDFNQVKYEELKEIIIESLKNI